MGGNRNKTQFHIKLVESSRKRTIKVNTMRKVCQKSEKNLEFSRWRQNEDESSLMEALY